MKRLDASQETALDLSPVGQRYAVERPITRGGMAEVYVATDLRYDRKVALKVMRRDIASPLGPKRFLREIAIAAKLSHPNIVPLLDSGEIGSLLYYVMPYVAGQSLRERLGECGQLPLDEALSITRDVAAALTCAHERHIIHRDIKPENILLQDGRALVTDFGIARALEGAVAEHLTSGRIAVGTVAYMSPEQATATARIDARSDLYSLALVLYEMLAGELPFHAATPDAMLARKAVGQYPPLRVVRRSVPPHLDAAVGRALSPNQADRFESVEAFVAALDTPARGVARGRRALIAVAAATLVIAGTVVAATILRGRHPLPTPAARRVLVMPLENRTGKPELAEVGVMAGDWMTEGLQRTGIVDVVPTTVALELLRPLPDTADVGHSRASRSLQAETGAGTLVAGSYYARGDTLLFRVDISDATSGRLLEALPDIAAPAADPVRGVEVLRNRLMGWLALHYDARLQSSPAQGPPPTYDAYRAFSEGLGRYIAVDYTGALPLFERAWQLDSSYSPPLLYASLCLTNVGRWAAADSLLHELNARRASLSDYDQAWLDYRLAFLRGDFEAALVAIREAARRAPQTKASYNLAVAALQSGHLHEALQTIAALPAERGAMRGFAPYWNVYGAIMHALGQYDHEAALGRSARAAHPDRLMAFAPEARSFAANGRLRELDALLREADGIPADPVRWDYGNLLVETAQELRAHGYVMESRAYLDRARTWLSSSPRAAGADARLADVLYELGRFDEARRLVSALRARDPSSVGLLGLAGVLDARSGMLAAARAVADTLAADHRPYEFGAPALQRARIAAASGDREAAVGLLRQALAAGTPYQLWLHRDADLLVLRGYGPFEAMLRGKD